MLDPQALLTVINNGEWVSTCEVQARTLRVLIEEHDTLLRIQQAIRDGMNITSSFVKILNPDFQPYFKSHFEADFSSPFRTGLKNLNPEAHGGGGTFCSHCLDKAININIQDFNETKKLYTS